MKFDYLNLIVYGSFIEQKIDFIDGCTFHLIYGPNEAGKSTTLRAFTDILYGIPNNTTDGYLHLDKNLRIGAGLTRSDGQKIEFVRRKGRTNTILDLDGTPFDLDVLATYLGAVDRTAFELMFGLNHQRLSEGGQRLLESGGSVDESLFEAASGITSLRALINELDQRASELYKSRGQNPPVNSLSQQYRTSLKSVAKYSLMAGDWQRLEDDYQTKAKKTRDLISSIQEIQKEIVRLERLSRTLPLLSKRSEKIRQLESLKDIAVLSENASEERLDAEAYIEQANRDKLKAKTRIQALEKNKKDLVIPQGIIEQREKILELYQRLGLYREYAETLPIIQGESLNLEQEIVSLFQELYPEEKGLENIERYRPAISHIEAAKELIDEYQPIRSQLDAAEKEVETIKNSLKGNETRKREIGDIKEPTKLQAFLKSVQKKGNLTEQLKEVKESTLNLERKIATELLKLAPFSGSAQELESLEVPLEVTLEKYLDSFAKINRQIEETQRLIRETDKAIFDDNAKIRELRIGGDVPSEEALKEIREHRDRGWGLILQAWLGEKNAFLGEFEAYQQGQPLYKVYEDAVVEADKLADIMRHDSKKVATKSQLALNIKINKEKLDSFYQQKEGLDKKLDDLNKEWTLLWQKTGMIPLTPKEMFAWRINYEKVMAQIDTLRQTELSVKILTNEIKEDKEILIELLTNLEIEIEQNESIDALTIVAENVLSAIQKKFVILDEIEMASQEFRSKLDTAQKTSKKCQDEMEQWLDKWSFSMGQFYLLADTTPKVATIFFQKLDRLFEKLDELKQNKIILQQRQEYLEKFDLEVEELVARLSFDFSDQSHASIVSRLNEIAQKANEDLATIVQIDKQIREEKESIKDAEALLLGAQDKLQYLMECASCQDVESLKKAEERSAEFVNLKKDIADIDAQLLEHGGGLLLEEIIQEAQGVDPDSLQGEIEEKRKQFQELDSQRSALEQSYGATRKEYEDKVTGNSTLALEAEEEAQSILSQLEKETSNYIRYRLAASVLRLAVERYTEENQDPVIKRAGEVFSRLTLGAFSHLKIDYDRQDKAILVGVRQDGNTVDINGMSDGTKDQLYLALRLASIEKYLTEIEPIPFIVDDILVNFDDERSKETLKVLTELSTQTQVIFFSHHLSLVKMAKEVIPQNVLGIYEL